MDGFAPWAVAWFALFAFSTIGLVVLAFVFGAFHDTNTRKNQSLKDQVARLEVEKKAAVDELARLRLSKPITPVTIDPKERRRQLQLAVAQKRQEADNMEEEIEELKAISINKIAKEIPHEAKRSA